MNNSHKKISTSAIVGQQGVNLVESIVLSLGCTWHPTTGTLEAGIDGLIELRDPATSSVLNLWIPTQVKSRTDLYNETASEFDFICDARDIEYWLEGNARVLLVVCRPATREAYWVIVNDYFNTPEQRQTRRVHFDKSKNKFDEHCLTQLMSRAMPRDSGIYMAPLPHPERLYSNLLTIEYIAPHIYISETTTHTPTEIWRELNSLGGSYGPEWILKNGKLWSFWELTEFPWNRIVDLGTVDEIGTLEWAKSDSQNTQRDLVQLLNNSLKSLIGRRLLYDREFEYYYFPSSIKDQLKHYYKLGNRQSALTVYQVYKSYNKGFEKTYCRHMAFSPHFLQLDGIWYLEITPTYHFSWNGRLDRFYEKRLSRIKQIEHQPRVLAQIFMWADFLREQPGLMDSNQRFLRFGDLFAQQAPVGIDDNLWLPSEDPDDAKSLGEQVEQFSLFEVDHED
jgi:hypothetical protein